MMKKMLCVFSLFILTAGLIFAGGNKDAKPQLAAQPAYTPAPVYWNGDGGKGIRLAVLEPSGRGLSASEQWMLSMIQSSITGDFQKYSAMTIIDRQNLEKILGEQKQSLSENYSDDDYVRIGKLTNARYILAGSVTKTANAFMLEFAITDTEVGERKALYPPKAVSPFALENLSAVKEATAELLRQLGVELTNAGMEGLNSTANIAQVKAETALAKGIEAQKQGTVVEALSYYIQANNYNTGLAEAASRMNILTADISSGNIGQDTRNDIAWRRQWVARLQETETFFSNSIKAPQPFYIVYSTDIKQGKIDYQKEVTELSIWMGFYPDFAWADQMNEVINAVEKGLQATERAQIWEIDWPTKSINTPSPFINQTKNSTSTVVVEIINSEGKSIGKQTVKSPYGFDSNKTVITPLWQWEGGVSFPAVDVNLITDKLTIGITTIDGIPAETASKQKNISVMPFTEWESMLKMSPSIEKNIVNAYVNTLFTENFDNNRATADFTEAIRLNPNYALAYINRGFTYCEKGDDDRAIADFTQAIRLDPKNADRYEYRAWVYYYKDDYNRAFADYTEAIRLDPKNADRYDSRAAAYYEKGDYDRAFADHTEAIRLDPKNADRYASRAAAYYEKGDYDRAIADYTETIRLDPKNADLYDSRAGAYSWKGDYDRAFADYAEAIRLDPKNADRYASRAGAYYGKGDYDRAFADHTEAIRLDPKNADRYASRAMAYSWKGDYDRTIADHTEAIRLDPKNADRYASRAMAYSRKGDYDRAIADYTEAIRLDPKNADRYDSRAGAYSAKNDYDRAIADYTEAIRLDPKNAGSYFSRYDSRARAYYEKGDYDRAFADYAEAIRLDPKNAYRYDSRAMAYYRKEDYDRAIADYTEAIQLEPTAYRYNIRGNSYYGKSDYVRAIADYTQMISLDSNNANGYSYRASAYYERGDYDRAIADYTEAIRIDPKNADRYVYRARAYSAKNDYDRAIADYTEAIRIKPDYASSLNGRGIAYWWKNDLNQAVADLEAALQIEPNNAQYRKNLEDARQQRGR